MKRHAIASIAVSVVTIALVYAWLAAQVAPPQWEMREERGWVTDLGIASCATQRCEHIVRLDDGTRAIAAFSSEYSTGKRVLLRGRRHSLDDARNPGEPSEISMERERGVSSAFAQVQVLRVAGDAPGFDAWLARLRERMSRILRERLQEPAASIVAGELLGERSALQPTLRAEFQETGTVHVLVTAGLHVGLIAWLILWLCERATLPRIVSCGIATLCILAFVAIAGSALPAQRAAAMAIVGLIARACGRASLSWNTLSIAAIVVILLDPEAVAGTSFWLSFCCVGAIFALAPHLERALERVSWLPDRVREAIVLSAATQIGTWPITAATFLIFSPYAMLANIAVVPVVPLSMLLAIAQLLFSWCAPVAQAVANLNDWIATWTAGSVTLIAGLPYSALSMTPAPTWGIVAYEAGLLAAAALLRARATTAAITLLAFCTSLVLVPPRPVQTSLRITVLDVGQADAIVIQTPRGHVLLVDAGGRLERGTNAGSESEAENVGERIVVPFLLRQGIHRITALIVSHPHGDHVGGCRPVLDKIAVEEIAESGQRYSGHAYQDCLRTARADRIPIVFPRAGVQWTLDDGVRLRFIGPSLPLIGGRNAINENSVAFTLQYRRFRMLFTGDAGAEAEQRFLREGVDVHADVLKVGHHGSAYGSSPQFIAAVHPRYAIISVGRHNLYGHPAQSTLQTLKASGATVLRTDEMGAAKITTDGNTVDVQPQLRSPTTV